MFDSAAELDRQDELRELRDAFWIPPHGSGGLQAYFCGHSLGLQPRTAEAALQKEPSEGNEAVDIVILTHEVREDIMDRAVRTLVMQLEASDVALGDVSRIRVEALA